ncbi:MAG TPA: tetratricopeptide repeat protein [Prosthecobacter sp.]
MLRTLLFSFLGTLATTSGLSAAGLDDAPEFTAAHQALADGLPGVAAVKAERLLKHKDWTKAETRKLATFAAEAWTRARAGEAVLKLVEAHDLDDEPFWQAQAQALTGNLAAARKTLTENAQTPRPPRAALLLAQILAANGEPAEARTEVEPLATSADPLISRAAKLLLQEISLDEGTPVNLPPSPQDDAAARYLRARSQLQAGQIDAAKTTLEEVLASENSGERLHHAAVLLQGEVLLRQKQPEAAQTHLLKVLDTAAECSLWPEAFDLLDRAHMALRSPRVLPESVLRWMSSGNTAQQQPEPSPALLAAADEVRGHATYLVARWLVAERRPTEAAGLLEGLMQAWPYHPRLADAMRMAMEIYSTQRADDRVLDLAESWRGRFGESTAAAESAAGGIFFRRGEHWQALQAFQDAANIAGTLVERRRALFNAAITAVQAGNFTLYQTLLGQLEVVSGSAAAATDSPDSAATLELEKALFFASQRKPEAEESLRAFVRAHPSHPRFADACVALAEWMLMASPPRVEHARTTLDLALTSPTTPEQRQRVDCTRLWLREASGDLKALVTEGTAFLKAWPKSALVPEVRLRIAGAHYRLEDYANARTEFEIIALNYPDTPHAETSLYFAAMSASSVMSTEGRERALAIWGDLAAKGGALAVAARRQQALSERAQGHLGEALAALDKLLAVKNLDIEQRRMTLCEKAEVLLLMGKTEPARLAAAVTLLDDFLSDTTLPMLWRARAGFTLATVHHDAGRDTEALEACYNVLRAADISPPTSPADYVWFSKAGFFGIDLLEAGRQWEPAARLAEQMAQRPSNRAAEARERATKIRLEHFLWDGPAPVAPKELKLDDKAEPSTPSKSTKGNAKG